MESEPKKYYISELYTDRDNLPVTERVNLELNVNKYLLGKYQQLNPKISIIKPDDRVLLAIFDRVKLTLPESFRENLTYDDCFKNLKEKPDYPLFQVVYKICSELVTWQAGKIKERNNPARIKFIKNMQKMGYLSKTKIPTYHIND